MSWPPPNDEPEEDDDALNKRLEHAAPPVTPATPELQKELSRLSVVTRDQAGKATKNGRFRLSRGAAFGLAALLFIGGGTAAVAVGELRSYWADKGIEPHASYSFELPSGAECEIELRMLSMGPPGVENTGDYVMTEEQDAFAHEMYSDAQARVDALIETEQFEETLEVQSDFPGAPDRTADDAYFHAVDLSLSGDVTDDYYDAMDEIRVGGYLMGHSCPGANFEGSGLTEYNDMDTYENTGGGAGG